MLDKIQNFNNTLRSNIINISIKHDELNRSYYIGKGNHTFKVKEILRHNGFRWSSEKGWYITEDQMQTEVSRNPHFLEKVSKLIITKLNSQPKQPTPKEDSVPGKSARFDKEKVEKYNMTAKDKVYMAWYDDPSISSEDLSELVNGEASVAKINSWRGGWINNERIPQKAAWVIIEELEEQIEKFQENGENPNQAKRINDLEAILEERNLEISRLTNQKVLLQKDILKAQNSKPRATTIVLKAPNGKKKILKGKKHPAYEDVITLASLRKNIFLPGPAGCGKSFLCAEVAKDLKLDFSFINCSVGMSEGHLLGRLLPVGKQGQFQFVTAEYVERYEKGGLFCADELDAADPNVLLVINTSISNGYLMLPNRPENPRIERHPDFVFVGCANTYGRGSDRLYVGRNQLDEATLDRFRIGTVPMDYDSGEKEEEFNYTAPFIPESFKNECLKWDGIEKDLCPDNDLRTRLLWYRRKVGENKLERIVSTRFMIDAYDMKSKAEWSDERIDKALFSGWSTDERTLVLGN